MRSSLLGVQRAVTEESQAQTKRRLAVLEQILPAGYVSNFSLGNNRTNEFNDRDIIVTVIKLLSEKPIAKYYDKRNEFDEFNDKGNKIPSALTFSKSLDTVESTARNLEGSSAASW